MQQAKREERYERILSEATHLFASKGYEQTTVSDIVKACDMARGTFYLYFENLEQVLSAVFSRVMNLLWEQVEQITGQGEALGPGAMRRIVNAIFHLLAQQKELLSVFRCGGGQVFNEFKYKTIRDHLGVGVANLIRNSQQNGGEIRLCSPELVSMMITTLIDQMAFYTFALEEDGYKQETVIGELVNFIEYGICGTPYDMMEDTTEN
ncbi:TetR/AcrR family transcriptional regulator [Tumebacillus sp. ITR2]|uniref:TetR/AcrR family transcriptional regulator n=1 Tax=Tumebacillus amylolyticus TaxID=2801339 RepID=A0ABS1JES2_9BACL|nr:TetR/AcrR family transcriptional regulator [Tumebacillus amylolyticus]MBL0388743.1 TetR/AcrR family transcriptional regulator [Tumebacillus amylolyticus]